MFIRHTLESILYADPIPPRVMMYHNQIAERDPDQTASLPCFDAMELTSSSVRIVWSREERKAVVFICDLSISR